MYTLGINAVFHDSSACIVKDGVLLAAAEEERFTHIKHGKRPIPFTTYELPFHAIDYCLKVAGIHLNEVDYIAYSFDPNILMAEKFESDQISIPLRPGIKEQLSEVVSLPLSPAIADEVEKWSNPWDPLFLSYIVNAPRQLVDGWPHHLQPRFIGANPVDDKWKFVDHHLSHAASAFLVSPFERAAVMTIDGRGEKATTAYYRGMHNDLELIGQVNMPHSLGLLYEKVTTHLGFLHSSDEYKVMALASYGKPEFINEFDAMIQVYDDGTYTIDDVDFESIFGPKRRKGDEFTAHHFNTF
jgi:carbamoyltransferase